jgi:C1A family cysteine protease
MYKTALIILAIFSATNGFSIQEQSFKAFSIFNKEHNKAYESMAEFEKRFKIFTENLITGFENEIIDAHDFKGLSPFMDLTSEEFKQRLGLNNKYTKMSTYANESFVSSSSFLTQTNDSIDYDEDGLVSPVKNQGQCGACWTFSTTGAIESSLAITLKKSGKPVTFENLSEQQLVDCEKLNDNDGCQGGDMRSAYQYLQSEGITTGSLYPYEAANGACRANGKKRVAKVPSFVSVPENNETELANALKELGPLSVGINATLVQFYQKKKVIKANKVLCNPKKLDHAVLIVGNKNNVYKVKNSWGTSFGDDGFFLIEAGTNACGIAEDVTFPNAVALS